MNGKIPMRENLRCSRAMESEGRYNVSGLDALLGIDGIMLADDWDESWETIESVEAEYLRELSVEFPASIFEVRGYAASQLRAEDVTGVEIYVSWNDEAGRLRTSDPEMIARVFEALQSLQATGSAPEDGEGLTFFVTLDSLDPDKNIDRSVWFRFEGDRLECDSETYFISGLENLFAIEDVDVLAYLREHSMD